jgi:hypothetical protein
MNERRIRRTLAALLGAVAALLVIGTLAVALLGILTL